MPTSFIVWKNNKAEGRAAVGDAYGVEHSLSASFALSFVEQNQIKFISDFFFFKKRKTQETSKETNDICLWADATEIT